MVNDHVLLVREKNEINIPTVYGIEQLIISNSLCV